MKNLIFQVIKSPISNKAGQIKIINDKNQILSTFENNLEAVPENHEQLKPENFLVINNPGFDIIFSGKYINEWITKRKQLLTNRILKKDIMLNKIDDGTALEAASE